MAGMNRRDFFKMIGVTGAASAAGCDARVPTENVIPYVIHPDEITPGVPTFYATICGECSAGCGVVTRTREGRILMAEGNPDNPVGGGSLCTGGLVSVQETYDPDRLQGPSIGGTASTWDDATATVAVALKSSAGKLGWLGRYRGGSLGQLIERFMGASGGRAVHWEPLGYASLAAATELAFGVSGLPRYQFGAAHTVVSFGAEFLHTWLNPVDHGRSWSEARDPAKGGFVTEFYAIEPRLSNSSARADSFMSVAPGSEAGVARALARLVAERKRSKFAHSPYLAGADAAAAAKAAGIELSALTALADKLAAQPSVIFPGGTTGAGAGATDLALATLVLNDVCGNIGETVLLGARYDFGAIHSFRDVEALLTDCSGGKIELLFIDGLDPVFSLPADVGVAEALAKVKTVVVLANSAPEGMPESAILLPPGSAAEVWGDSDSVVGNHGLQQPSMQPLHDTRSVGDTVLAVAAAAGLKDPEPEEAESEGAAAAGAAGGVEDEEDAPPAPAPKLGGHEVVASFGAHDFQRYVAGRWYTELFDGQGDFVTWWRDNLMRGGFFPGAGAEPTARLRYDKLPEPGPAAKVEGDYALLLFPHSLLHDGRHANKAWAQEIPHPMSGYTWNTWAEIAPATAEKLGVTSKDTVRISSDQGAMELGVFINPGMRTDSVGIVLGNGHKAGNRYSKGWGENPVSLLKRAVDGRSGDVAWSGAGVSLARGASENPMTNLKGSQSMDDRPIALDSYVADVLKEPTGERSSQADIMVVPEDPRLVAAGVHDMFPEPEHPVYRFAMDVNLDRCVGCGVCEMACAAENNIPSVGPYQHQKHRYMNWIRLSRFFEGDSEHPDVRFIPVMCQQCSHAPCEGVCPVMATYHNLDGLNAMVYNRCVGTRYCANNCPYSARRFNYHTFRWPESYTLQLNPDISTREMGIMEKCTFCIQRIRRAKADVRNEHGTVSAETLRHLPACAAACPTDALTLGNRKDKDSEIAELYESPRSYSMLSSLNTKPGVQYTTKINFHRTSASHGEGEDHASDDDAGHGGGGHH